MTKQQKIDWVKNVVKNDTDQRCDVSKYGGNFVVFVENDELMMEFEGKTYKVNDLSAKNVNTIYSYFGLLTK